MHTKSSYWRTACISILCFTTIQPFSALAQEGLISCGGPFQEWHIVSGYNYPVEVRGKIKKIDLNNDGYLGGALESDFDWNIFINPFSDYEWMLKGKGDAEDGNKNEIEAEVLAMPVLSKLRNAFPEETSVVAKGWYVVDMGHPMGPGGKTEIHPLQWMMSLNQNPTTIFAAVDHSQRFIVAPDGLSTSWFFNVPTSAPVIYPGSSIPSETRIIHQEGELGEESRSGFYQNYGSATLWVDLPGRTFIDCSADIEMKYVNKSLSYYLGKVTQSSAPLLKEEVSSSIVIDEGVKVARLHVKVSLENPAEGTINNSTWTHSAQYGFARTLSYVRTSAQPHNFDFFWDYRPANDFNEPGFRLDVVASTKPEGYIGSGTYKHTLLQERRVYSIKPSDITLVRSAKQATQTSCPEYISYTIDYSDLIDGISATSVKWSVKHLRTFQGRLITPTPPFVSISPGSPFTAPNLQVGTFDPPNNNRADVTFTPVGAGNLAEIILAVEVETELGETIKKEVYVNAGCGFGPFSVEAVHRFIDMLARRNGLGIERYKWIKIAKKKDHPWIVAYSKWSHNEPLTKEDASALLSALEQAKGLKEIKFDTKKPFIAKQNRNDVVIVQPPVNNKTP